MLATADSAKPSGGVAAPESGKPGPLDERRGTVSEVRALAEEIRPYDNAVAIVLARLADAVSERRLEEARAYADALDPRGLADALTDRPSWIWSVFEVARNVLIFAPIAVTWYGLSTASVAYAELLHAEPKYAVQPFLLLWQESFYGTGSVVSFSTLATIDAALIGLLILLSLAIHTRAELHAMTARSRVLLRESEIRGLIGHAVGLAGTGDIDAVEASGALDQMIAEERRIFERASEREQQLFNLETAVTELRAAAGDLARAAASLRGSDRGRSGP